MAAGDIKGPEVITVKLVAGVPVTKGQVVGMQTDDLFDPAILTDTGKFAVAIEDAAAVNDTFLAVIWGRVEVTASAAAITPGAIVMAATTGLVVAADTPAAVGVNVGTATEAFAVSGNGTVFVGLVN